MKIKIAIILSGSGSNARCMCAYFQNHSTIETVLLLTNKADSGAKDIGNEYNISYYIFNKNEFYESENIIKKLIDYEVNYIVLAGFLWLIPDYLLKLYSNKIINIHPALLPKYGGKGMYGMNVHRAVYANKERESGITIHLCNEKYDEGKILFQDSTPLESTDTPDSIAKKVLNLEHQHYAKVVEHLILANTK